MDPRRNKPVQILTLAAALTLFGSYIVYSQKQQARSISQAQAAQPSQAVSPVAATVSGTNKPVIIRPRTLSPGSKSLSPVVTVDAPKSGIKPPRPVSISSQKLAPGSKAAAVFDFQHQAQPPHPNAQVSHATSAPATNSTHK